jgi:membrane-bound metal-dependent hydrolase YbcI (DUF457 family)
MFVGHLAVAVGAKKVEPRVPLWGLVAASFGIDLLWPLLLFAGIEVVRVDPGNTAFTPLDFDSYPWSHSLLMSLAWGAAAGAAACIMMKSARSALLIAAVVVSHWLLDFLTHMPDLPLWPGGPEVGLGLWNSIPATMIVEGGMLLSAIILYQRWTSPIDRVGRWAFWGLIALTGLLWASQPWAPPAPSSIAVATTGLFMWLLPFWAGWIERHRTAVGENALPGE